MRASATKLKSEVGELNWKRKTGKMSSDSPSPSTSKSGPPQETPRGEGSETKKDEGSFFSFFGIVTQTSPIFLTRFWHCVSFPYYAEGDTVTMCDVLEEEAAREEDAVAVLGPADHKNCSYMTGGKFYPIRCWTNSKEMNRKNLGCSTAVEPLIILTGSTLCTNLLRNVMILALNRIF